MFIINFFVYLLVSFNNIKVFKTISSQFLHNVKDNNKRFISINNIENLFI